MLYLNFLNFEIILDLQKSCKNSNEKFEILCFHLPKEHIDIDDFIEDTLDTKKGWWQ